MGRIVLIVALAATLLTGSTGCAGSISRFIVQARNHQGDLAFQHQNAVEAAQAYKLALRVDPKNGHARTGLAAVQLLIAAKEFKESKFDEALASLAVAAKYDPQSVVLAELKSQIEAARVRREIVVSNYPTYRETGLSLRRSYAQLKTQSNKVVATLQRFDYSFDSNELQRAIRQSSALNTEVSRLTSRLKNYRQLVESGSPEKTAGEGAPLAPAASLLPLP